MDLFWQNEFNTLEEKQEFMFNNNIMADIKFKVKNSIGGYEFSLIPAHKYVLATSSGVFHAMFFGELATKDFCPIIIHDVTAKLFLKFLKYLYTYKIEFFHDTEEILSILYLAKKYMIPKLVYKCKEFIKMLLNAENVCIYLVKSKFYGEADLIQECWNFIKFQAEAVLASQSFCSLDHETLCQFLNLTSINVCTERIIYDGLVRWAHFQCHHDNFDKESNYMPEENIEENYNDNCLESIDSYPMGGCHAILISQCLPDCPCCSHCPECCKRSYIDCPKRDLTNNRASLKVTPQQIRSKLGSALFLIRFGEMSLEDFSDGPALSDILSPREVIEVYLYHHGTSSKRRHAGRARLSSDNCALSYEPYVSKTHVALPVSSNRVHDFRRACGVNAAGQSASNTQVQKSLIKPCRTKMNPTRARPHSICTVGAGVGPCTTCSDPDIDGSIMGGDALEPCPTSVLSPTFPCLLNPRPRPPLGVCSRFGRCSSQSSWRYDGRARDSIQFSVDRKILLVGLGLYGSSRHLETPFTINAKLFQCDIATSVTASVNSLTNTVPYRPSNDDDNYYSEGRSGVSTLLLDECINFTSTGSPKPYHVTFKGGAATLNPDTPYLLSLVIRGGDEHNWYGQEGSGCVVVSLGRSCRSQKTEGEPVSNPPSSVRFSFEISSEGSNGTSVQGGQIPQLLFYCY